MLRFRAEAVAAVEFKLRDSLPPRSCITKKSPEHKNQSSRLPSQRRSKVARKAKAHAKSAAVNQSEDSSAFGAQDFGSKLRASGSGFRVYGSAFRA